MAQEIMVAGAIYEGVPSVRLPDSHGTFHPFTDTSDTTAVAADVAQGKTFHLADGSAATGTAAGATLVTKSITANGTYSAEDDDADGYSEVTVNVSGGGGASNMVTGTFTTPDTTTPTLTTVSVPYTGSGYPVHIDICVHGGVSNPSNTGWYGRANRYKVGQWHAHEMTNSAPSGSANEKQFMIVGLYKNNASTWNSYGYTGGTYYAYREDGSTPPGGALIRVALMDGPNTLMVSVGSTSYGFQGNTEYDYTIVYSE